MSLPLAATRAFLAVLGALALAPAASAQETVDLGVLKDRDVSVVQNVLFPRTKRLEIGVHAGWMAFDPLVTAPNLQVSIDKHISEKLAISALIGGGYGFKTLKYTELEGPAYGVAPYAFGYLGSALAGVSWAPVYAKMSLGGTKVVHYDIHGTLRGGLTLERSIIPGGGLGGSAITIAPTVSIGIGSRFWVTRNLAIRAEIRDDLMVESRPLTDSWNFKQNAGVMLGVTFFGDRK